MGASVTNFQRNRPVGCWVMAVGVSGEYFYTRDGGVWVAAKNDHGDEGWPEPTVRAVAGWFLANDGFKFQRNRPSGCRDMGVWVGNLGGGGVYVLRFFVFLSLFFVCSLPDICLHAYNMRTWIIANQQNHKKREISSLVVTSCINVA